MMDVMSLHFHTVGTGAHHVVAVHGWFTDRTGFAHIWPHLDTEAFSYAFLDVRGYGEAMDRPGPYTMANIAADVLLTADELGWGDFSLLGHSMGGVAIARTLLDAPDRVNALVGVAPVPPSGFPFDEAGWQLFDGAAENPDNRRQIIDYTTGSRLSRVWVDSMVQRSITRSTTTAFADYLPEWGRADFADELNGNATPMLVLTGAHDPAVTADLCQQTWARYFPNAELEVIENAGHYPADEAPVALATRIEAFLRDV